MKPLKTTHQVAKYKHQKRGEKSSIFKSKIEPFAPAIAEEAKAEGQQAVQSTVTASNQSLATRQVLVSRRLSKKDTVYWESIVKCRVRFQKVGEISKLSRLF
ncbi:hypothetical protein [Niallia taxi]|uniref:hypothetical protein n=1 Tax=Niallia taxi TaxID=2499688 RepID=UPI002E1A3AAF|nr:hypothetical protein [Niallia taxi]